MSNKTRKVYKSSVSGKIVSKSFALKNPETTFADTVPVRTFAPFIGQLRRACKDLLYLSETDSLIKVFVGEKSDSLSKADFIEAFGFKQLVEERSFENLMIALRGDDEPERAAKFDKINRILTENLNQLSVFVVGAKPQKTLYFVGLSEEKLIAGLKVIVVET